MTPRTLTNPSQIPVVARLVHDGPGDRPPDGWAVDLLRAARTLPNERSNLRAAAAARAAEVATTSATRRWAALVGLLADPVSPSRAIAAAVEDLAEAGLALYALQAFSRLSRRARIQGRRVAGEALQLAALGVCDAYSGAPALRLAHHGSGRDSQAAVIGPALGALGEGPAALGAWLEAATPALAGGDDDLVAPALRAAVTCLRSTPGPNADDLDWLQGLAARGLGFALPGAAEPRFAGYDAYLRERNVHPVWHALFVERWAHILMQRGRLHDAGDLLGREESRLTGHEDAAFARITLLRARARASRYAGDLPLALSFSDEAVAAAEHADGQLSASSQAGVWLNRSAILLALDRRSEATEAATRAAEFYQSDGFSPVGETEARELEIAADPDRGRAARLAAELVNQDKASQLPAPIRATALWRSGEALGEAGLDLDLDLALATLDTATTLAEANRSHVSVEAPLAAARILLGSDAPLAAAWANRATRAARQQHNLLLRARAGLLKARCEHAVGNESDALIAANAALQDLTASLVGLTADGNTHVLQSVGDDLRATFDLAVAVDDPHLALRVAELGRAIRLAAMMRLKPEELPPALRAALSEKTAATKAADGDGFGGEAPTADARAAAAQTAADSDLALAAAGGEILRTLTVDPVIDPERVRSAFPTAHLLTLSEHHGTLRWAWWAPGADAPTAGSAAIDPDLEVLLDGYAGGHVSALPGDVSGPLHSLIPPGLIETLLQSKTPAPLLISPMGRLWNVPYPAIPLHPPASPRPGNVRLLAHAAVLTLTPSLWLAHDIAERDRRRGEEPNSRPTVAAVGRVAGYCNPTLPGARMEQQRLSEEWGVDYAPLQGVETFGQNRDTSIEVMATHATSAAGLAQAIVDHSGSILTAGQCIPRNFSRTVILGTCHGYGGSEENTEPIGLLTIISARGATWVAGGHQHLHDATVGWILSNAYQQLRRGATLPDAIRSAQIAYLQALEQPPSAIDAGLAAIVAKAGGRHAAQLPWCWALTVIGPATADSP